MNTQTHLLFASAVLIPAGAGYLSRWFHPSSTRLLTIAVLLGALLPDASLFLMFVIAKTQGVAEELIWSEWYYSNYWQNLGAITNSIPVFASAALGSVVLSVLLHTLTDLPLHHDDGHPHFWPFSSWIYASPVSYWDPNHYGHYWSIAEMVLAGGLIVFLWRRFGNLQARSLLVLAAFCYAAALMPLPRHRSRAANNGGHAKIGNVACFRAERYLCKSCVFHRWQ